MQRYSENCVRGPQTSRGLAGARETCCCVTRVGGGVGARLRDCSRFGRAAVAAAAGVARLGLARGAGAVAPAGESAAVGSVGVGFAPPASAAIGALAGDAGAGALAGESAAVVSVGVGFAASGVRGNRRCHRRLQGSRRTRTQPRSPQRQCRG